MSPAVTTLYITRHGETVWNVEGRLQGHLDSELSARGQRQVVALANRLSDCQPTALYTSDLGRTLQTAGIIARACTLDPLEDLRLRERHLGVFQGLTPQEIRVRHPGAWRDFQKRDPDFVIPEGESARQRTRRTLSVLAEIAERHPGERVVVVGHGGTLDSIFRACSNLELGVRRNFSMANASLNTVSYQRSTWQIVSWGDTRHLDGCA